MDEVSGSTKVITLSVCLSDIIRYPAEISMILNLYTYLLSSKDVQSAGIFTLALSFPGLCYLYYDSVSCFYLLIFLDSHKILDLFKSWS